jgi:PAS domain S-box-containing protein
MSKAKAGILIVEDSFIVAYHLQATLESEGYVVLAKCDSGESAVQFVETTRPDLVLMDITLSGKMDGIHTAEIMKTRFGLPVIYITALTDKETISRAKITEPYGYLTKPFEDREVFTVIEMALYKHDIESKLKQSEERYLSTVSSISDAVLTIDRNCCITYMNPSAIGLTEWSMKEATGKSIIDVLKLRNDMTDEIDINPIQCAVGGGNLSRMPEGLVLLNKHGIEIPIGESSLSPLLDNKGRFIGLIIVFKDMTEKKEHERLIREIERHRVAAIIEGQEKERSRIAKDLHDGLGQMLNAIKMNVKSIASPAPELNMLSKLMDEAIQESVRISENLVPAKLRDFDLATCLKSFCAQMSASMQAQISFDNLGTQIRLNQSQKVNLYRIAQEAVNNAIKHSNAENITVQLSESNDYLRLSVEDDGSGISAERISIRQNGLINMRDRAEIMGGKLTIESDPQRGTMIIVEIATNKLLVNV